ncbi:PREDICTED: uncharacterized protein LOC104806726 isoform X2 [Tarenaya hassleriana]|uniref:uncharacterized protein LOC104806726 isoform X2 n=1 Tax=Tarenaya hassleriana TaxID=28532 RepID=UPI00053C5364|nr:PREDICTED: uncharacterized protein LOC104806726 isoform X2 [Tarenaya hassleriana]
MSSACKRLLSNASISSLRSATRSSRPKSPTVGANNRSMPAAASPLRHFSLSRCPSELGCVQSLLPLHSAVAAARLTSCLSTTSSSCRALSQELGLSVPR